MNLTESRGNLTKKLLIVDGSNLAFRMYYALERTGLTSPSGKPSWAIFGFFKALLEVIEREKPTAIVTAFDASRNTFRTEACSYYKANRPSEMPEALKEQWGEIYRGIDLLGVTRIALAGYEADDIIGTLSLEASREGWQALIFSGDRDILQLVDSNISAIMPSVKGISKLDSAGVKVKLGVPPELVADFKALCGDSSDNIKGVPGVGKKTAIKLLEEFNGFEEIYRNINKIPSQSLRKKLIEGRALGEESLFLARIKTDCPLGLSLKDLSNSNNLNNSINPDIKGLSEFLREYKLVSIERKLMEIFAFSPKKQEHKQEIKPESPDTGNIIIQEGQISLFENPEFKPVNENSKNNDNKSSLKIKRELITEEKRFFEILSELTESEFMSLDLETTGLDTEACEILGFSLAWHSSKSSKEENNKEFKSCYVSCEHVSPKAICESLKKIFENNLQKNLFIQNIKYEYKILKRYGWDLPRQALDTMLGSYLLNPEESHGLKAQSLRVFNYKMTEITELIGERNTKQKSMKDVPLERVSDYACDDAALTLALGEYYLNTLGEKSLKLWKEIESPLAFLLSDMELTGIKINVDAIKNLSLELSEQVKAYESEITSDLEVLCAKANVPVLAINLNSGRQLADILKACGFKLTKKTSSGQLSTDIKVLERLKLSDETGVITKLIEFRALSKLKSTYAESLSSFVRPNGRIATEFNQALTSTGRLSSSNPNLQNIPVKNKKFANLIRSSFEASENKLIICADYSQIELRILAHYTEDPVLLEAFLQEQDIHARTAAEIFQVNLSDVTSEQRRLGKTLNFALIYQQGVSATARQLGVSNTEATEFIEKYFAKFQRVKPFVNEVLEKALLNGYTETLWGRRRYFKHLHSFNDLERKADERAAFNACLQGSAADIIKIAMLKLEAELKKYKELEGNILLQVHDELLIEIKESLAKDFLERVKEIMSLNKNALKVPLIVSAGIGKNWTEAKN